jgi:hypothetical protein
MRAQRAVGYERYQRSAHERHERYQRSAYRRCCPAKRSSYFMKSVSCLDTPVVARLCAARD